MTPMLLGVLFLTAGAATAPDGRAAPPAAPDGELRIEFNTALLVDLGIDPPPGKRPVTVPLIGGPGFDVVGRAGRFAGLRGGSARTGDFPKIAWRGGSTGTPRLSVIAIELEPPAFALIDDYHRQWLRLEYGHPRIAGGRLHIEVADLAMGEALAAAIGRLDLEGLVIGAAELTAPLAPASDLQAEVGDCTVPEWPTEPGADADIAMTRMETVEQTVRSDGRVAITPSAYFRNVGTADVPWLNMFATPESDPDHCLDDGGGTCEPYGTDQGGKLVWAFYRFVDGRLEQLGRSAVKHAFNSVNFECPCSSGRIVWEGCEDLYGVNTNENRDFLGPREELMAHGVLWDHRGSIFDSDGDDQCDVLIQEPFFGGQRCDTMPQDELERRLHVSEADLSTAGARYFMETWYLVRDDVDIMNSFGRREVLPSFLSIWSFPFQSEFTQGPVIDEWAALHETATAILDSPVITAQGQLRLSSSVTKVEGGHYRYDFSLMNFNFDPTATELSIPIPSQDHAFQAEFFDGDDSAANDWVVTIGTQAIVWSAPEESPLPWGAMASFRFRSGVSPETGQATLTPGPSAKDDVLNAPVLLPAVFTDGFEP